MERKALRGRVREREREGERERVGEGGGAFCIMTEKSAGTSTTYSVVGV